MRYIHFKVSQSIEHVKLVDIALTLHNFDLELTNVKYLILAITYVIGIPSDALKILYLLNVFICIITR